MRTSLLLAVVLAACGGEPAPQNPQPNQPLPLPSQPSQPRPSDSCLQVLQCVIGCAETDEACQNACLNRGTQQAQNDIVALATCVNAAACGASDCVMTSCGTELTTCVGGSVPTTPNQMPLPSNAPPGNIPADMVGVWSGARDGETERFTFNADGTAEWDSSTNSSYYACGYSSRIVRTGTAVIEEKLITLYAPKVEERIHNCTGPDEVTPRAGLTAQIQWSRSGNPNEILVIDEECANQFPEAQKPGGCLYAGCPIGLYCTARLQKQ